MRPALLRDHIAMHVRRAVAEDIEDLLSLYAHLDPSDHLPPPSEAAAVWSDMLGDGRISVFVGELHDRMIATCVLVLVPNLTRGARPFGFVENVVIDPPYRRNGHGTRILRHALEFAWEAGCYKVMLMTGSKRDSTLHFYEQAGFRRGVKTGFVALAPDR